MKNKSALITGITGQQLKWKPRLAFCGLAAGTARE